LPRLTSAEIAVLVIGLGLEGPEVGGKLVLHWTNIALPSRTSRPDRYEEDPFADQYHLLVGLDLIGAAGPYHGCARCVAGGRQRSDR
jgi:hypothetical protein